MRAERLLPNTVWFLALLLGQASLLLGLMIALGWAFAFVLIFPKGASGHGALPIEPPLIGLALGAIGLALARCSSEPIARYSVAGLILNAVPLILALVLLFLR